MASEGIWVNASAQEIESGVNFDQFAEVLADGDSHQERLGPILFSGAETQPQYLTCRPGARGKGYLQMGRRQRQTPY